MSAIQEVVDAVIDWIWMAFAIGFGLGLVIGWLS